MLKLLMSLLGARRFSDRMGKKNSKQRKSRVQSSTALSPADAAVAAAAAG